MTDIRFGIIGCGTAGKFHAEAIKSVDGASLTGVFDSREEAVANFAKEYGVGFQCSNLDDLLARDDIDVVSVCTPTGLHASHSIQAVRAGKHVLVEKPVGIDLNEIDCLDLEAKRAGVKLGVCLQWRTHGVVKAIKQAIDEGKLGKIHMLSVCLKYYRTRDYYAQSGWRGTWKYDGGGALMNQGTHALDILLWIAGPAASVYGQIRTALHNIEAEDTAAAIVNFESGALGTIEAATSTYPGFPVQFEVHGDKGSIVFSDSKVIRWDILGDPDACFTVDSEGEVHGASSPTGIGYSGHIRMVRDMTEAVQTGREPAVSCTEARRSIELIHAIYRSAREGRAVTPGSRNAESSLQNAEFAVDKHG